MVTFYRSCFLKRSCRPFRNIAAFWVKQFVPHAKRPGSVRRSWQKKPTFPPCLLAGLSGELNRHQWTISRKLPRLSAFGCVIWSQNSKQDATKCGRFVGLIYSITATEIGIRAFQSISPFDRSTISANVNGTSRVAGVVQPGNRA